MINCREEIKVLKPYVPGKSIDDVQKEYNLSQVVKLASNENPLGFSQKAKNAIIKSLENGSLYPDGNCTELRKVLSNVNNVNPNDIVFGAGSDEIITMIGQCFIGKDDEAITCTPSFPRYASSVQIMGGKIIEVPLINNTYDLDGIINEITEKTKVIFIANPNNPTGTIVTKDQQFEFMKKIPSNILVVFDEAYGEYIKDSSYPNTLEMMKEYDNIILLKTFSKMYGLASLRIGYGVSNQNIIDYLNRVRGPFNVSSQAQIAAIESLNDTDFVNSSFETNELSKDYTYKKCMELGFEYIPTFGNFIMIDFKTDSIELFKELQKIGYIVRPGYYFGMNTYQRVTLGTVEEMKGFFDAIIKILKV